jgi:two-component system, OmpR family, KDP operon response regulator KdpE
MQKPAQTLQSDQSLPLHLDLQNLAATFAGEALDFTPREFAFLVYLARNVGKVCTRRMVLENVWGPAYVNELQYLKVYAYRIRRKLHDPQGLFLESDPSVGCRLVPAGAPAPSEP